MNDPTGGVDRNNIRARQDKTDQYRGDRRRLRNRLSFLPEIAAVLCKLEFFIDANKLISKLLNSVETFTLILHNHIIFFRFYSETSSDQMNRIFCVVQIAKTNTVFFNWFPNARDNGMFSIGSIVAIVNPDSIEDCMNDVPMIVSNEQAILLRPILHRTVPVKNHLVA